MHFKRNLYPNIYLNDANTTDQRNIAIAESQNTDRLVQSSCCPYSLMNLHFF